MLSHVSKAIMIVHDYIYKILTVLCPEKQVKNQLWDALLVDKLIEAYRRAMTHTRFLLDIERKGTLSTFNHYFNANLQRKRSERVSDKFKDMAVTSTWGGSKDELFVPMSRISKLAIDKDNGQQVCEDILDTLMSYYKVSRKRFVDIVCQQAIFQFLLEGDGSPLKVLDSDLIMNLDNGQLEQIASEDVESKHQRQVLTREVGSLEAALKVLRF